MRPQTVGLVLCALVFTTFGHELSRAKHVVQNRRPDLDSDASVKPVRDYSNNAPRSKQSLLLVNAETNLIGALNATAGLAVIFDVNAGLVATFHRRSGDVIVYNIEAEVGAFIRGDSSLNIRSLRPLYGYGLRIGERFDKENVSYDVSAHLQYTVLSLTAGEHSATLSEALEHIDIMTSILLDTLRGPLRGVLASIGSSVRTITVSLRTLVVRVQTLGVIISRLRCGTNVLAKLNWQVFFNEPSPIQLFISVFSTLRAQNIDIGSVLRDFTPNFTVFLASLGGNSTVGLNGILRVAGEIKGMVLGRSVVNGFVPVLVEYFRNSGINPTNIRQIKKESLDFLAFVEKQGLTSELHLVVNYFRGIVQNHFLFRGINGFRIIQIMLEPRAAPLHNLVRVLNEIEPLVKIEVSTGLLIYYLAQLTLDNSIDDIRAVLPAVTTDDSVDILEFIFRGAKISELRENLYRFLLHRHIFGPILTVIDGSCDNISLEDLFKTPEFAPFGRAITRLLERKFRSVRGQGQVESQLVGPGGNGNHVSGRQRSHSGIKTRHLDVSNKKHGRVHKLHGHERHHNKENHQGHGKHHQLRSSFGKHHAHGKHRHHEKRGHGKHHVRGHARKHSHKDKHRV